MLKRPVRLPDGSYMCAALDQGRANAGPNTAEVKASDWDAWLKAMPIIAKMNERMELVVVR